MAFSTVSLPQGTFALNGNGHIYCGGSATWDSTDTSILSSVSGGYELKGFTSGSISISGSSVTNEARGIGGGWAQAAPGGRSATLQLSFLRLVGDTAQDGLLGMISADKSTWSNNGVALAYGVDTTETASGGTTTTKLHGFGGVWILTDVSIEQSGGGDNDANAENVSLTFSAFGNLVRIDDTYTPSTT